MTDTEVPQMQKRFWSRKAIDKLREGMTDTKVLVEQKFV